MVQPNWTSILSLTVKMSALEVTFLLIKLKQPSIQLSRTSMIVKENQPQLESRTKSMNSTTKFARPSPAMIL